jgi:hypothetical protein
VYYHVVNSIFQYETDNKGACVASLQIIERLLRQLIKIYYDTLVDSKISRSIWMAYCQGFQGWAAGELIDGVYFEYDVLSGNQLPFCHIIDAFLGLEYYLTDQNREGYIPVRQRDFSDSVRKHSFRQQAKRSGDSEIEAEMEKIVWRMRVSLANLIQSLVRIDIEQIFRHTHCACATLLLPFGDTGNAEPAFSDILLIS